MASLTEEMEAEARKLEARMELGYFMSYADQETLARRIRDWVEVLREQQNEQTT